MLLICARKHEISCQEARSIRLYSFREAEFEFIWLPWYNYIYEEILYSLKNKTDVPVILSIGKNATNRLQIDIYMKS